MKAKFLRRRGPSSGYIFMFTARNAIKKLGAFFSTWCFCVSIVPQFHENFHAGSWYFGVPIVTQNICLNEYMWNFAVHLWHHHNFHTWFHFWLWHMCHQIASSESECTFSMCICVICMIFQIWSQFCLLQLCHQIFAA